MTLIRRFTFVFFLSFLFLLVGCQTQEFPEIALTPSPTIPSLPELTPFPTRESYQPGELVEYTAQMGDSLPALAARFNSSVDEILSANPVIPSDATTLPPGLPMQIPIYFRNFWGSPYQIIPDNLFINGPASTDFNSAEFVEQSNGWLRNYQEYAAGDNRSAAEIVDLVALNFSLSPRLLFSLIEYQSQGLTSNVIPENRLSYPLGYENRGYAGLYLQLVWAANNLNNGYYGWRGGSMIEFNLPDGSLTRPDPWQNAATIGIQHFFASLLSLEEFNFAISEQGFTQTYHELFGAPWENVQPHIPGSLNQPPFILPFEPGDLWAYTGGPHTAWGTGAPWAALDFAPPSDTSGCFYTEIWATAVADGLVVRSEEGIVVLDLDMDGDERTGWVVFYLHLGSNGRPEVGAQLRAGDPIGHPSCEGGNATGTHIHIARKYNGEWIMADSILAFEMEGWIPHNGSVEYQGTLTRFGSTVTACDCTNRESFIMSSGSPEGFPVEIMPLPTP